MAKMVISHAFLFIKQSLVISSDEESYLPYEQTGENNFMILFQVIYPKMRWERSDRICHHSTFYLWTLFCTRLSNCNISQMQPFPETM